MDLRRAQRERRRQFAIEAQFALVEQQGVGQTALDLEVGDHLDDDGGGGVLGRAVADRLEVNWLRDHILALPRDTQWSSLARLTLRGDLYADHRDLTAQVVADAGDTDPETLIDRWMRANETEVDYFRRTITDIRAGAELGYREVLSNLRTDCVNWVLLLTDGLRTKSDFNHDVGMNVVRADGSVQWLEDAAKLGEILQQR